MSAWGHALGVCRKDSSVATDFSAGFEFFAPRAGQVAALWKVHPPTHRVRGDIPTATCPSARPIQSAIWREIAQVLGD